MKKDRKNELLGDAAYLLEKADIVMGKFKKIERKQARPPRPKRESTVVEGKEWESTNGYMYTYYLGKPVLLHRRRVEELLGRPLRRDEKVSFRDENKLNCNIENLCLTSPIPLTDFICSKCRAPLVKES
jgi:hypothetical protein